MRLLPALFLTGWFYSFLIWGYVVARLLIFRIQIWEPFIYDVPITFWQLAIAAFVASAVCMFGFLTTGLSRQSH